MPHRLPRVGQSPALTMEDAYRIVDALGPIPGETLAAMADYGLSDAEISQYFNIPHDTITILRQHWGIAGTP